MTTRSTPPVGAPCWTDLWTSDVAGAGEFYGEVFGWEAQAPDDGHGGYFMFTRDGVPVAGGMGDVGRDMKADNRWKPYLATPDMAATLQAAQAAGAKVMGEAMAVDDLGIQAVVSDPAGAVIGFWQPVTFPGFTVLGEHGSPSWVELHTTDHSQARSFYQGLFGYETTTVGDTDEFRYTTVRPAGSDEDLIGIMDASGWLPPGVGGEWSVYWAVDDVDETLALIDKLGGSLVHGPESTPYGRLACAADPCGAQFKLRNVGA
ncbi:MAG TPA: VOC family protein [Acidimicrobiales bacterium]|nr:VOC family protein [Acidimicrobiales bacterium]